MLISSMRLRQLSLILGMAVAVSACSTIADLDPTGLLGGNSDNNSSQFPATGGNQASAQTPDQDRGTTPDLASIPARPAAPSADAQQQAKQSLANDGAEARYSAQALRGGTEPAAPPPTASDVAPSAAQRLMGAAAEQPSAADVAPTAEAASQTAPQAAPMPEPKPEMAAAAPQLPEGAEPAPEAAPAVPGTAKVETASAAPDVNAATPVGPSAMPAPASARREPAVPPNAPVHAGAAVQATVSDAELGFKPSNAPPLDPSVAEFVAAPIVARYRRTASNERMAVQGTQAGAPAVPAVPARTSGNGSVVANLGAITGASAAIAAMNGGVAPTEIVYFPGDGTSLDAAAKTKVRAAAGRFKADGGQGTVRVVGHSSSRTADMPVEKHLETIFDKSQARANAVAQELIKDGVPAPKVLIDAVGDSQPIYYESMPKGEEGNRRAEIFVQQ